jgi:hypothetical protein
MAKKKKIEEPTHPKYDLICKETIDEYGHWVIPEGATYLTLEINYAGCWYESDRPSHIVRYWKDKPCN